jgi:hypothetical protein
MNLIKGFEDGPHFAPLATRSGPISATTMVTGKTIAGEPFCTVFSVFGLLIIAENLRAEMLGDKQTSC